MGEPVRRNRSPPGSGRTLHPAESSHDGLLQQREGGKDGAEPQTGHATCPRSLSHTESL